ncbi:YecA family protein [Aquibacillus albus]|uniref:Uncharacterized protein YecA (UPF0149 family) n=1 Tax=Aquibacillus albus TaxID=1168171 RepID=A0ABS2MWY9_9BACI|nr:SEC-C domain-containing protein [Aquibacillus albus]MBM7570395.1 uncharacterized protein YecA (UPF0149 family) [Aquibacillus albus]
MSKPKRNEPCPCGSGKKYKKCCGSNVIQLNHQVYNDELDQFHGELISFAFTKYKTAIEQQINKYDVSFLSVSEKEAINSCLNLWTILHVPITDHNETIFDIFYAKQKEKIKHTRTKDLLASWSNMIPSVYEIESINEQSKQKVTLLDVRTKESYHIPMLSGKEFSKGDLLTGILVPYVNYYNFFLTALEIDSSQKEEAIKLLDQLSNKQGGMNKHYPNFLLGLIMQPQPATESLTWDNDAHVQVASLFSKSMNKKGLSEELTSKGVKLWNLYCQRENPNLKKPSAYAAALDYLVQVTFLADSEATQKEVADEYGASAGTVSSNFRKLTDVLDEKLTEFKTQ